MIKSKKIKVLIISILCILTITIGLSYGYYLLNKVQENNNIAGSKCFNLKFTNEKNAISLDNMYPISDEEGRKLTPYSFTITNTCDMLAGYTVNMEMLEGTTLNSKYLDVMINNEEIKLLTNYESTNTVITGSTESRILAKGTLAYNDSVDYTVRFWMDKDVEDTEAMNKIFKSKIVISATPSSWNPKDAGYDTLHDAILANEYQVTPEDAIKKIEAKGTPDLSQTAPVIKWVEKKSYDTYTNVVTPNIETISNNRDGLFSDMNINDTYITVYKTKIFDENTGKYSLSNPVTIDPTDSKNYIDSSGNNIIYYFQGQSMLFNDTSDKLETYSSPAGKYIYILNSASKEETTFSSKNTNFAGWNYKLNITLLDSVELENDNSDVGLYNAFDNYGTTYYYRGNVKNNIVKFAGFYWQIVRINGDGSIRLIYDGTEKNATGNNQILDNVKFNNLSKSPAYAGYMFGDPFGTTYDSVHNNTNSSTIKEYIDFWYKNNFDNTDYKNYLSLSTGFCGDRTFSKGDGISSDKYTYFKAYSRATLNTADFVCSNENNDLYTVKSSSIGNKSLTYPIGLITFDELIYSGLSANSYNTHAWSYSTSKYWTMTPSYYSISGNQIFSIHPYGFAYLNSAGDSSFGIRPVINLKSDVKITGGIGTSNDPYVIDTNN